MMSILIHILYTGLLPGNIRANESNGKSITRERMVTRKRHRKTDASEGVKVITADPSISFLKLQA